MNYTINIIDTTNNELVTQLEKAVRGGARLSHKGGDKKDGAPIIGSSLDLGIIAEKYVDGYLYNLFTGNETKYKVEIIDSNDNYIWQGHVLPDQYEEPFSNTPVINITASDGLGRLKGKYLQDDFYRDEKSVIEIISACLKLTGLDLNIRFAPAIENYQQKDYNLIYLPTNLYKDKEKRDDAYSILNDLLGERGMQSIVYQQDNHFNIEGINVREQRVYKTKEYTIEGEFIQEVEITRNRKRLNGIATPIITMQPPYGVVNINHERVPISIPETAAQEKNDGWVSPTGSFQFIYATDWFGFNGFNAKAAEYKNPEYANLPERKTLQVYFGVGDQSSQFINLRNRPYLVKGQKYRLNLDFRLLPYTDLTEVTKETFIENGQWTNPFRIQISNVSQAEGGGEEVDILFGNSSHLEGGKRYIEQAFGMDELMRNELDFIANKSGLLNFQISPVMDNGQGRGVGAIEYVAIEEAEIEVLGFEEDYLYQKELNEEYTVKKEIDLTYADDSTGFSRGFRLQKLTEKKNYNEIDIPILRGFQRDGWNYIVVSLASANLVKENPEEFYSGTNNINVEDVIYNYNNSEDHVIKSTNPVTGGILKVRVYDFNSVKEDRGYWEQWTDSLYKIEKIRYAEVVGNIYNRLFNKPIPKILNFNVKTNVKFNDFVLFNWRDTKEWMMTNSSWDIDQGFTDITIVESYYSVQPGENIPPVVEAGNDIILEGTASSFELTSEGYDPDGFIVSYSWTQLEGDSSTILHPSGQNTTVNNFTGDYGLFEVVVTDNDGATASDTVKVFRNQSHEVVLPEIETNVWQLTFDPNVASGSAVNVKGRLNVGLIIQAGTSGYAYARIEINGSTHKELRITYRPGGSTTPGLIEDFSINYFSDDIVTFHLGASAVFPDSKYAEFRIDEVEFIDGQGSITGLPQTKIQN